MFIFNKTYVDWVIGKFSTNQEGGVNDLIVETEL